MTAGHFVLVADDDRDIRDALRFLLEIQEGYVVAEAADGAETLTALRDAREPLVVLLDQVMPQLTGMEVLRTVADEPAILQRTRFVLFSARQESFPPADTALLLRLGVFTIRKPFEIDEVLAVVRAAAESLPS
jgi:CheY-like chemotaxis protein